MTREHGLVPDAVAARARGALSPLVRALDAAGVSPNAVTLAGTLLSVAAGAFVALEVPAAALVALVVGSVADTLDGALARHAGRATTFGAFLDSLLDRVSDAAVLVGAAVLAFRAQDALLLGASLWAIVGAFLVAYARAKAESLSKAARVGVAPREARLLALVLGVALWALLAQVWPLTAAIGVTAALATVTVAQRVIHVARQG